MAPRLIEGDVMDEKDTRIAVLEQEIDDLRDELRMAKAALRVEKDEAGRAVAGVRRVLSPMFNAMKQLFGEMDAIGGVDEAQGPSAAAVGDNRVRGVWEEWVHKLGVGSAPARVVEALLTHGELSVVQLKVVGKMANQTVYGATSKLNRLGLLNKNGGKYSLKKL